MSLPFGEETGHFLLVRIHLSSHPPSARALILSFSGGRHRQRRGTRRVRVYVARAQRRPVAAQRRMYIGIHVLS
jgi:hypothetical protein